MCQPWGAGHSVAHTADKDLPSVLWYLNSCNTMLQSGPLYFPLLAPVKGKHPTQFPQEAKVGTQHNGDSSLQVLSLGFSNPDILFRLEMSNGKFWVNHLALNVLARPAQVAQDSLFKVGLDLGTHRIIPAIEESGKAQQQCGGRFRTLPQPGSLARLPLPPSPALALGLAISPLRCARLALWPSGSSLSSVLQGVVRASSQNRKAVRSCSPLQ